MQLAYVALALVLWLGAAHQAMAQNAFTSISRSSEMLSTAEAELRGASPPASPERDAEQERFIQRHFNKVDEDTTANAVVTNGPGGGTDFGHTIVSTEQYSEIRTTGVVLCAESRVFATIKSAGPGVPSVLFATGTADNLFDYTFGVAGNTRYTLSGEMSSFPGLDENDAELEFRGPLSGSSAPLIFSSGVVGEASKKFNKSGTLGSGIYKISAGVFANLSGGGGSQPDTAGAEIELYLQLGTKSLNRSCQPINLGGVLLLLLGD
ncbi:MAG: hypothetical protein HKN50_07580 [Gammaproteobacteria bacterium]|nr:hypothetical protein [Gammaproteobacteria bacterium]